MEPKSVWSIPWLLRVQNKKSFWYSLPRKKVSLSYGNLRISRKTNFKNRSFSPGQGVIQIRPNSLWSMPCIPRVQNKNNFWYSLPRKKLVFHTEICDYFQCLIFKSSIFHRVKELFKWNQSRYGVFHGYLECKTKRVFGIACLERKLVFHTEICEFRE